MTGRRSRDTKNPRPARQGVGLERRPPVCVEPCTMIHGPDGIPIAVPGISELSPTSGAGDLLRRPGGRRLARGRFASTVLRESSITPQTKKTPLIFERTGPPMNRAAAARRRRERKWPDDAPNCCRQFAFECRSPGKGVRRTGEERSKANSTHLRGPASDQGVFGRRFAAIFSTWACACRLRRVIDKDSFPLVLAVFWKSSSDSPRLAA